MRNASLDDSLGNPREALSMMYYDTLLHDPAALRLLLDTVGADRVMLGSDMPFPIGDPTPRAILDGAGVSAADRDLIESGGRVVPARSLRKSAPCIWTSPAARRSRRANSSSGRV